MDLQQPQSMANGRHLRRSIVAACLTLGVLSAAACGTGSSSSVSSTTQRTVTPTTAAPTAAAASALAAYRAMWADMVTASLTSNYQSPLLSDHASGEALSVLVQGLAKNQAQGIVAKGKPVLHPQIASLTPAGSPTQAIISDCFDDTHWLEYKSSGGLVNRNPGGHRATTAIATQTSGAWKVTQLAVQATGTC
jgi:hypothetical protein